MAWRRGHRQELTTRIFDKRTKCPNSKARRAVPIVDEGNARATPSVVVELKSRPERASQPLVPRLRSFHDEWISTSRIARFRRRPDEFPAGTEHKASQAETSSQHCFHRVSAVSEETGQEGVLQLLTFNIQFNFQR